MTKTKLSRRISYMLRHDPDSIDENGWADVSYIVGRMREMLSSFDEKLLEEIVAEDEKGRYSYNEDRTKIRANQGHSIPVDVELEVRVPPEILWHGTGEKYVPAILTEGLRKKKRLYVHLSGDYRTAVAVGSRHGKPVVFQVDAASMYQDGYLFYQSANHVWLTDAVPPQYLHMCQQEGREEPECSM